MASTSKCMPTMGEPLSLKTNELVPAINRILDCGGIQATVDSLEVLKRNGSSLLVAALEGLLDQRLVGIERAPRNEHDYLHNASVFLSTLKDKMISLENYSIDPQSIVDGEEETLKFLCSVLLQLTDLPRDNRVDLPEDKETTPEVEKEELDSKADTVSNTGIEVQEINLPPLTQVSNAGIEAQEINLPPQAQEMTSEGAPLIYRPAPRFPVEATNIQYPLHSTSSTVSSRRRKKRKSRTKRRRTRSAAGRKVSTLMGDDRLSKSIIHATRRRPISKTKSAKMRIISNSSGIIQGLSTVTSKHNYPGQVKTQLRKTKKLAKAAHKRRCSILLRDIEKTDRESMRSLIDMDAGMKRDLLSQQLKAANKEEIAIAKVHKLSRKMEQQYLQDLRNIYKDKIAKLELELQTRTQSIQNYFRDQYLLLQDELRTQKKNSKIQKAASKKMNSQIKKEIKESRKKRINNLQAIIQQMENESEEDTIKRLSERIFQLSGESGSKRY